MKHGADVSGGSAAPGWVSFASRWCKMGGRRTDESQLYQLQLGLLPGWRLTRMGAGGPLGQFNTITPGDSLSQAVLVATGLENMGTPQTHKRHARSYRTWIVPRVLQGARSLSEMINIDRWTDTQQLSATCNGARKDVNNKNDLRMQRRKRRESIR